MRFGKNLSTKTFVGGMLAAIMAQHISIVEAIETKAVFQEASPEVYSLTTYTKRTTPATQALFSSQKNAKGTVNTGCLTRRPAREDKQVSSSFVVICEALTAILSDRAY
jgi:hypothetical protein